MTERKCILTGDRADPETLIRLAIGPEGQVLPDVRAKAPGRGAWIGVTRTELESALAKGKLKGAIARSFKDGALQTDADLPDRIESALRQDMLSRLGLESRGGMLLTGSEKIDTACRKGLVKLLLHAGDAAADGNRKLDQALRVGQEAEGSDLAGIVLPVDRDALSMAMGRDNVVHIAVTDSRAALRLRAALGRLEHYLGCAVAAPAQDELDSSDALADETVWNDMPDIVPVEDEVKG